MEGRGTQPVPYLVLCYMPYNRKKQNETSSVPDKENGIIRTEDDTSGPKVRS